MSENSLFNSGLILLSSLAEPTSAGVYSEQLCSSRSVSQASSSQSPGVSDYVDSAFSMMSELSRLTSQNDRVAGGQKVLLTTMKVLE